MRAIAIVTALWLALGACHAPHQAPKPYIDKYRGKFDAGWDVVVLEASSTPGGAIR